MRHPTSNKVRARFEHQLRCCAKNYLPPTVRLPLNKDRSSRLRNFIGIMKTWLDISISSYNSNSQTKSALRSLIAVGALSRQNALLESTLLVAVDPCKHLIRVSSLCFRAFTQSSWLGLASRRDAEVAQCHLQSKRQAKVSCASGLSCTKICRSWVAGEVKTKWPAGLRNYFEPLSHPIHAVTPPTKDGFTNGNCP